MSDEIRIQGHIPDSKNEINVAMALDELKLEYIFQYQVGMPGVRGSQVIDFLVYTIPLPTPLFVHGRYWHEGRMGAEDTLKMAELTSQSRGRWADPVIVWGEDTETVEDAKVALQKELML